MRVLLANKFLYPRGGAERAVLDLGEGLRDRGHQVFWFGMEHPENSVPPETSACVRRREYRGNDPRRYRDALAMLYSWEARRAFARFLDRVAPDIVHVHNIYHQLTPAILDAARQRDVPVLMTLHDYKLVCPRYDLLRHGALCDSCVEEGPTACLRHRCAGSWGSSLLLTAEAALHRSRGSYTAVRCFLAPSRFLQRVMQRGGLPTERLRHVANFAPRRTASAHEQPAEPGRFLFVGRLSAEKGLDTLLRAVASLEHGRLIICGSGPLAERVRAAAERAPAGRIECRGHVSHQVVAQEMSRASFTVLPSEWFENAPFAALEAMAAGRAVVASRIGGIPELVQDEVTGDLVPPGDVPAWTAALARAVHDPRRMQSLGTRAREVAQRRFGFEAHVDAVLSLYHEVLQ